MIKHLPAELLSGDVLIEPCVALDLAQLIKPMYFDRRYALCIQKFYYSPHFTVGGTGIRACISNR